MTGLGQRFETIIAVCSSVVPFICGIHNNAIILRTAFVGKEILWLLFFSWGSWEGIWWCRESWAEAGLGLSSSDSFFVVLRARTHQLVRLPWLLAPRNLSVPAGLLDLQCSLFIWKRVSRAPRLGTRSQGVYKPQKAQHCAVRREDGKELSNPRPEGSCKCSSAKRSFDCDLNGDLGTANIQWRIQRGFK